MTDKDAKKEKLLMTPLEEPTKKVFLLLLLLS